MTSRQRHIAAQTLATLEAQDRHATQLALATPVIDPADLSALCKSNRVAAGALLAHLEPRQLTVLAIACAAWANESRDLTGDAQIRTEDILARFDAVIASYRTAQTPEATLVTVPYFADDRTTTGLTVGAHDLDDRTVEAAYRLALARHELLSTRWQNALRKAFDHLYEDGFRVGIRADGAYFWHPDDDQGGMYAVQPNECPCKAFAQGNPCKHRAAAIILSFYNEADARWLLRAA